MSASEAPEPLADDDGWIAEESGSRYENLFAGHVLPILKFRRWRKAGTPPSAVGWNRVHLRRVHACDVLALRQR